jgi:hypothetical protein
MTQTTKELYDQRKKENRELYESIKQFKRQAKDGKRGQRLGMLIDDDKGNKVLYIPYTQYTKITNNKTRY